MDYRVILIENNRVMLERLSSVIRGTSGFELDARYQQAGDALGQGQMFQPNLILLDIDTGHNLALIPEFAETFPGAAILCLSGNWDAGNAAQVVKAGAKGYLIKPFSSQEFLEAVQTFGKSGMASSSETLAFFSPKGKSGKTTLVANLALSLARKSGDSVGIIDADLQFGDMAVFFNLSPQSTIVEAVRDIKFLSPISLNSYFVEVPEVEKLRILCGTKKPDYAELVDIQPFEDVVRMAQSLFRYVLIDLPPGFNPISVSAAEMSTLTYMVAMISGGFEVQHMKRAMEIFKAWPDYEKRVKPVFTRVEPCTDDQRKWLSGEMDFPVDAILPNEYLLVSAAANNGRMAMDDRSGTVFADNINRLADEIIGRRQQTRRAVS